MSQQSANSCPSVATSEAKLARLRSLQPTLAWLAPMVSSSSSVRLTAIEKAALPEGQEAKTDVHGFSHLSFYDLVDRCRWLVLD